MCLSNSRRLTACMTLLLGLVQAAPAAEILISDAKSQPESLTLAPGGVLFVGSASSPYVYKVPSGSSTAEKFIDVSSEGPGTFFLGMLADASGKTLWTCQLTPVPGATPARRKTALRSWDIATGKPKLRWDLPGDSTTCNDFTLGHDKALYLTDTATGKIYKLPKGAKTPSLLLQNDTLLGVDGITFLKGVLYVNNVKTNKLYRVPIDKTGKASDPVEITLDQPVKGPDGMRAANGKLLVAENGSGKISAITVSGDTGSVTVLKEGLKTPTGVEPAGDTIWIAERGAGKAVSMPMPK